MSTLIKLIITTAFLGLNISYAAEQDIQAVPYIRQFDIESIKHGRVIDVSTVEVIFVSHFSKPGFEKAVGLCFEGETHRIEVLQSYWNVIDQVGRETLIFHELGHCVLNRVHDASAVNGVPSTLLNPTLVSPATYLRNRNYYLQELFR